MKRVLDGPALPAAIAAVALVLGLAPGGQLPEERPRSAADLEGGALQAVERVELLGDLSRGADVAGWSVESLEVGPSERVHVTVARDGVSFRVVLSPRGAEAHGAPRSTRTRDLFYTTPTPHGATVEDVDRDAVLAALAERVEAGE